MTARDIADELGLAVSTVGRALSDDPRISPTTKAKVRAAADRRGYVPDQAARMMRGAPSSGVGLVVPDISNSFYAATAHHLAAELADHDRQLVLGETADDPDRELQQVRALVGGRAAVVLVPTASPLPETVTLLGRTRHIQLLRRSPAVPGPWIGIDDQEALARATGHLLALGHRRLAYIGGSTALPTGAARLRGFRAALQDAGLPVAAGPTYLGEPSSTEHGVDAVRRILADPRPPTGLVCASGQNTRGVVGEVLRHGTRVPDSLSVVGFGDEAGWSWWGPGLTTTVLPTRQLARLCAEWVLDPTGRPPSTRAATDLVVRGSTAPPPSRPSDTGRATSPRPTWQEKP